MSLPILHDVCGDHGRAWISPASKSSKVPFLLHGAVVSEEASSNETLAMLSMGTNGQALLLSTVLSAEA
jgi:hypothetical protein